MVIEIRLEFRVVRSAAISAKNDIRFNFTPFVCRRAHVLFTLLVFVCIIVPNTYNVMCLSRLSSSFYVASFSGSSLFWLSFRYFLTFIYKVYSADLHVDEHLFDKHIKR